MVQARNKASAFLAIILGMAIIALCGVAQQSSVLTPLLAPYPILFSFLASGGIFLLLIAAIVSLVAVIRSRRRQLYPLSLLYVGLASLSMLNPYGAAFQLSVGGLTVGGSLVILGGTRALSTKRKTL